MKAVIHNIQPDEKRKISQLWRYRSRNSHVRKVNGCDSVMTSITSDSNPVANRGRSGPVGWNDPLGIENGGFEGKKSIQINSVVLVVGYNYGS